MSITPSIAAKGAASTFPATSRAQLLGLLYFAFVIGTSTAVSDVEVTSRTIRKTVIVHGIVAFVFNVTLIALTVSIAGDAISAK